MWVALRWPHSYSLSQIVTPKYLLVGLFRYLIAYLGYHSWPKLYCLAAVAATVKLFTFLILLSIIVTSHQIDF